MLKATLDERWPRLANDEALSWLRRFREGRSPYARVRVHVIRCQLDAIIALALGLGLRRGELFRLRMAHVHGDNEQVVVLKANSQPGALELECRLVPFTDAVRAAVEAWTTSRWFLAPEHTSPWLNLHAATTAREAMTRPTFDRLLRTYVGPGWSLKRLRDTCAAGWVRAGLPLEHLRHLLGLSSIEATLPYARLIGGSLDGHMVALDEHFDELVGPVRISDVAA
jgi:site-specific recombinase XerD